MRRLILKLIPVLLLCLVVAATDGCRRKRKRNVKVDDEPAGMATMVHVADPRSAVQLVRGFHGVESGAWRWTQKTFAVVLKPPANSATTGANLQLKFSLPEVIVQKLGPMTISAHIGDTKLEPEKYEKPGDYTYSREVPPAVMKGDSLVVEFSLDKALAPGEVDARELGIIAQIIGFEAKQ